MSITPLSLPIAIGNRLDVNVNRLTSTKTVSHKDPYSLALCPPKFGFWDGYQQHQNLGQFLIGSRIESSPYELLVGKDEFCKQLCVSYLGHPEVPQNKRWQSYEAAKIQKPIRQDFHQHFIVDNLSAASISENEFSVTTRYYNYGVPLGYVDEGSDNVYVYNHLNFVIGYTPLPNGKYNILRLSVEPFSILQDFTEGYDRDDTFMDDDPWYEQDQPDATIIQPIRSCDRNSSVVSHTSWNMLRMDRRQPQPANGRVLFTYDVIWEIDTSYGWEDRWKLYLTMDNSTPPLLHVKSLVFGVSMLGLAFFLFFIMVIRPLRRYTNQTGSLTGQYASLSGVPVLAQMKGRVFQPPVRCRFLLAILCGTGAQCLTTSFLVLFLAACQTLSAANRGALPHAILFLYMLCGFVGGYVAGRFASTFGVYHERAVTKWTVMVFPTTAWVYFITTNLRNPIRVHAAILLYWFGIGAPLVWLGTHLAGKHGGFYQYTLTDHDSAGAASAVPTNTNANSANLPVTIPTMPRRIVMIMGYLAAGGMSFAVSFVEADLVTDGIFYHIYYDSFRYLAVIWILVLLTASLVTVSFVFYRLNYQGGCWWWTSFLLGGSYGIVLLIAVLVFFDWSLELAAYYRFCGYFVVLSFGLVQTMGFVGVLLSGVLFRTVFSRIEGLESQDIQNDSLFLSPEEQGGGNDTSRGISEEMEYTGVHVPMMVIAPPKEGPPTSEGNAPQPETTPDSGTIA